MRKKSDRRVRHTAELKSTAIANDALNQRTKVAGGLTERIKKDKTKGHIYKSINVEGQKLYVKLSTKKES